MKVRVLRSALEDLSDGRQFYDQQHAGVGAYFFDSLFSEIDSLVLYAGIHRVGFHRLLARRFPYAVYYRVMVARRSYFASSIAAVIQGGFGASWKKEANQSLQPTAPSRRG
jgi:hypothetical protein